jgi:hypothetical protein
MHAYQKQYLANLTDDKPLDIGETTRRRNKRENMRARFAARLCEVIAERKPTARGFACAAAARAAWIADDIFAPEALDGVEVIWWGNHDADGRMICRAPATCSCARCASLLNKKGETTSAS